MEVLAKRVKWLRERKRLGQKEVAAEIGLSLSGYQKIEYNERDPKLEVLINLTEFFKVSSDFLLGLSDSVEEVEIFEKQLEGRKNKLNTMKSKLDIVQRALDNMEGLTGDSIDQREEIKRELIRALKLEQEEYKHLLVKLIQLKASVPRSHVYTDKNFLKFKPKEINYVEESGIYKVKIDNYKYDSYTLFQSNDKEAAEDLYREVFHKLSTTLVENDKDNLLDSIFNYEMPYDDSFIDDILDDDE